MADDQREGHSVHVEIQVLDRCLVLVFIDAFVAVETVVDILAILVILAILAVIFGLTNFIILRVLVLIVFSNFLVVRLVA